MLQHGNVLRSAERAYNLGSGYHSSLGIVLLPFRFNRRSLLEWLSGSDALRVERPPALALHPNGKLGGPWHGKRF